jgi:NAD pyrophosphatase/5'-nucleotidase NadN
MICNFVYRKLFWAVFTTVLLTLSSAAIGMNMTIIHVNDTHSHLEETSTSLMLNGEKTYLSLGGVARMASKIKEIKEYKPDSLVLHAGDAIQGTLYFTKFQGEADFHFLNVMGFDAMVLGNHEFDLGSETVASFETMANFPIISGNMNIQNDPYVTNQFPEYMIKEIAGQKVAVFGLTTADTSEISSPGDYISFDSEITRANEIVAELKEQGINKIIALTHMGFHKDIHLAEAVDGIDVIVGGHSHSLLGDLEDMGLSAESAYPTHAQDPSGNAVCVVQAWEWGKIVGVLDVSFDDNGHVISCAGNPILLAGDDFKRKNDQGETVDVSPDIHQQLLDFIETNPNIDVVSPDSDVLDTLNTTYKPEIEIFKQTVVANVPETLFHIREPGKHTSGEILMKGSLIAPHVCEAMCWFPNERSGIHVDMSIQNAGGVRIDIEEGDLTVADVYTLLPFANQLVVLELTGQEILTALETGVERSSGAFPYVGRARFSVNMEKPEGHRIVQLLIKDETGSFVPVNPEQTYMVATNAYIAGGGDGYTVMKEAKGKRQDNGFVDAEVFQAYAEHIQTLHQPQDTGVYYMHMLDTPSAEISILPLGTYDTQELDESAAEIPSFDPETKRLFMINGADGSIDIMDISDPFMINKIDNIDLTLYGKAANSCAFHDGILAVAVENMNKQAPGKAVLFDAYGNFIKSFEAGALPDMIKFSPDGKTILVANEGEPDDDYEIDPEGSVTIIDLSDGIENAIAFQVDFTAFNSQKESLQAAGVRIYGLSATVAMDVEPEYIAVSKDSKTAWISLQENNALAVLDIDSKTITHILPFGYKDHTLPENSLDVSDKDDQVNMQTWPVFGMYMPDSIDAFKVEDTHYIVTANEGDSRDYDGFSEEARIQDIELDPVIFPNAEELQSPEALGHMKITTVIGDEDQDGDYDKLYSYGARSFSIWRQDDDTLTLVYDSKNDFERIINALLGLKYDDPEKLLYIDGRSDDKGAEPEGVAVGTVDGRIYAFIGLERFSGLMIYDITDPVHPEYVKFLTRQNLDQELESGLAEDVSPEGVLFISAQDSPTGKALVVLGNEVSGTTTVYEIVGLNNSQDIQPEARPESNQGVINGVDVFLDARGSFHENGIIVGYHWEQTSGTAVNIENFDKPVASFISPDIETDMEELVFTLTVTDVSGNSDTASIKICVINNTNMIAISEIQGESETSPMAGETVSIEGIVVGDFQESNQLKGFFVQSDTPDDNPKTSEGILVYEDDVDVCLGDRVRVQGVVKEYKGMTEISPANAIAVIENDVELPEATEILLPLSSKDELESYEGMRVSLTQRLTVSDVYELGRYGQFKVSNGRLMIPTSIVTPGEKAQDLAELNERNQIIIGDYSDAQNPDPVIFPPPGLTANHTLRTGHEIENVTGVLRYSYGYQVHPTEPFDICRENNPRHYEPSHVFGKLTVASFNVLNYFNGPDFPTERGADTETEFIRQRDKIINAIIALQADVIGLMEIENDGFDENAAIQDLVNGLNERGPRTFSFVDPQTERIGTDAITVGIIYDTDRVEQIGQAATLGTGAFAEKNRQPLAQSFKDIHSNEVFTVVVNHFKSKGCDEATGENADQNDGQGCWNPVREQASEDLLAWLNNNPTGVNDPDILVIGDLNAYAMEDPINVFAQNNYTNLAGPFIGKKAWSYVYFGQAGYLDYAISSPHLTPYISSVHYWHINADEPICLDYNMEYKNDAQIAYYYEDHPFRSSDHDPVIIGLDLTQKSMWPMIKMLQLLSDFDVIAVPSWDINGDGRMGLADAVNMLQQIVE